MLFWQLADHWGLVRPDGVLIPIRLTHDTLAALVAARRPTVSAALCELQRDKRITRVGQEGWLLHGQPLGADHSSLVQPAAVGPRRTACEDKSSPRLPALIRS